MTRNDGGSGTGSDLNACLLLQETDVSAGLCTTGGHCCGHVISLEAGIVA